MFGIDAVPPLRNRRIGKPGKGLEVPQDQPVDRLAVKDADVPAVLMGIAVPGKWSPTLPLLFCGVSTLREKRRLE